MKKLTQFATSFVSSLGLMFALTTSTTPAIATIQNSMTDQVHTVTDLTELIKMILATVGGILTTIILAFLKAKFPDWFPDALRNAKK